MKGRNILLEALMVPKSISGNVQLIVLFVVIGMIYSCSKAQNAVSKTSVATKSAPISGQPAKNISNVQADSAGSLKRQTNPAKENRMLVVYISTVTHVVRPALNLRTSLNQKSRLISLMLSKKNLEWKTVNVEESGNEHFNNDYKLYTKSVIVSTMKDGKEISWKNLDRIWQIIHDETKYREYIKNEVAACLKGKCL